MPENCEGTHKDCEGEIGYSEAKYIKCNKGFEHVFCKKCLRKYKNENNNRI